MSKLLSFLLFFVCSCIQIETVFSADFHHTEKPIIIQLNWLHQFQFAGYYAALDQGYFRDEGLTVILKEGGPKIYAVNTVLEKKAHYGIGSGGLLLQRLHNKPLVLIASIFQHSAATLAISSTANIKTPHDLVGKQVSMLVGGKPIVEIAAMLEYEGITLDKINMQENKLITENETYQNVEFIYSTNSPYFIEKKQLKITFIRPINYGIDFYGDSLFTTEREIKDHPDRVKKIQKAVIKGWQYALQHPDDTIDKMLKKYSIRFTPEHLKYEASIIQGLILPNIVEVGHSNASRWKRMADTMIRLKMIPSSEHFDGFIYQSNDDDNVHIVWGVLGVITTLTCVISFISLSFVYINRQLKKRIILKTAQLQNANNELENIVKERTDALHLEVKKYQQASLSAKKANQAKGKFLSAISHEIRTPLNAVVGCYFLLKRTELTPNQEEHLQQIYVSSQSLCHIIDDILDFSKTEAGTLTFKATDFDLIKLTRHLRRNFLTDLNHKNITFNILIAPNIPKQLNGFELRLMQVLNNLLSNAIKFSYEHTVITLSIDRESKDIIEGQYRLNFNVIDHGIGIENHQIKQLFKPFSQLNNELSRNYTGTGLGLSISQNLVKVMGGKIQCDSTINKGSTFRFSLPFRSASTKVLKTTKIVDHNDEKLSSLHLLIVDDNKLNLFIAEAFIKPYIKKITTANSGKQALTLCNEETYSIVLMDIQMPIMDGYQTTYHIRQNKELSYLPIIAMTAHVSPEDRDKSLQAGMNDHITKPLDPDSLLTILRKWA